MTMRGSRSLRVAIALVAATCAAVGACHRPGIADKLEADRKGSEGALPASARPVAAPTTGLEAPKTGDVVPMPRANGTPGSPAIPVPYGAPTSFAPLARTAAPGVVTIVTKVKSKHGHEMMRGLGTGFLIDRAGTIVTNNHVVAEGNAIEVVLFNDKSVEGKVLGTDPMTDVAIIKIDPPPGVEPLPLGDSDAMSVGDWVFAIGNPLGLSHTVTAGILSAKGRTVKDVPIHSKGVAENYFDFLQTDCAINPGNSGGPLLNLHGEVIGMNTAINASGQGLAFAIPINMVKQMIPSLIKEGHLVRAFLGVGIEDAALDDKTGVRGAMVNRVWRDTPADKAGLKEGDHILAVDGTTVRDSSQMRWLVSIAGVGKSVTLRVVRDDKAFDLPVTLGELPTRAKPTAEDDDDDDDDSAPTLPFPPSRGRPFNHP